jgi:hypothetical protein
MQIFMCAKDVEEWKIIKKGYTFPKKDNIFHDDVELMNELELKAYSQNCKAMNSLVCSLSQSEFNKISSCKTAKEIWDRLETLHERNSKEDDSSSEEEQELPNFCLMGIKDEPDEVLSSSSCDMSFSNDELQDAFDELYHEFLKLKKEHKALKRLVALPSENDASKIESLNEMINTLTKERDNLVKENINLKKEVEDVSNTLTKFVKGKDTLNKILGSQRGFYDKTGLGYTHTHVHRKKYVNAFSRPLISSHILCVHCNRNDHIPLKCPNRYRVAHKGLKWVVKTHIT